MQIIIPMAGRGSRFAEHGWQTPKPLIEVGGRPMVLWALESLRGLPVSQVIFVLLEEHEREFHVSQLIREQYHQPTTFVQIPEVTEGQLCTVLAAKEHLNPEEDVLIMAADSLVIGSQLASDITAAKASHLAGLISVIDLPGDRWSFARTNTHGAVVEVAEKVRISNHASTGFYYFTKAEYLLRYGQEMIDQQEKTRGEYYVIPVYQKMIDHDLSVGITPADSLWDMGTPEAKAQFEANLPTIRQQLAAPRFSICIPNYNYAHYLDQTLDSILAQTYPAEEIVIADNRSTDGSVALIQQYQARHSHIHLQQNPANFGFAGNLDQVAQMATQPLLLMLSSDDLMKPTALATYRQLIGELPPAQKFIITSAIDTIDADNQWLYTTTAQDNHRSIWLTTDIDPTLTAALGIDVYKIAAPDLLHRLLLTSSNPFHFLATCYQRTAYDRIGGYGQGRLINPDKWFHWRLLGEVDYAYFVDAPLFQYRWHERNQTAQQANSGHLKYIVDEYRTTIEMPDTLLQQAQLSRSEYERSFIEHTILHHGLSELSKGLWLKAYRINRFGWATYPGHMWRQWPKSLAFGLLLAGGPLGIALARSLKSRMK